MINGSRGQMEKIDNNWQIGRFESNSVNNNMNGFDLKIQIKRQRQIKLKNMTHLYDVYKKPTLNIKHRWVKSKMIEKYIPFKL